MMKNNQAVNIVCPNCQPPVKLITKTDDRTGEQFLACLDCGHTEDLPPSLTMRQQGQKSLFD
jgi:uncharacterized Zn finger protein